MGTTTQPARIAPVGPGLNPKFGFLDSQRLTQGLGWLDKNPLAEIVLKDVTGFNAPKILVTRTWKERLDVATLELSNTAITLSGSLLLPWLLRYPVSWLSGVKMVDLIRDPARQALAPAAKLAQLGSAFGFMTLFGALFWAAPFFRNWLTAKRTGTANFQALVGLERQDAKREKRSIESEMAFQKGMGFKVLAAGGLLSLASIAGFGLAARRAPGQLPALLENLFKTFHMAGGIVDRVMPKGFKQLIAANQVNRGWPTLLFWLLPAYGGWLHGARSRFELKEQALKAANGVLWFSLFNPMILDRFVWKPQYLKLLEKFSATDAVAREVLGKMKEPLRGVFPNYHFPSYEQIEKMAPELSRSLRRLKNGHWLAGLAITITMLGLTPQLLNIYFTRRRYAREHGAAADSITLRVSPQSPFSRLQTLRT